MYDPLGLSIGSSNLVAARNGSPAVTRRAVLTLFPDRAPEIGVPEGNPGAPGRGTVTTGFVERVGDPTAMVSADGSAQDPELLLVDALDAMISAAGGDAASSDITIAVPAYWGPEALRALRKGLRTHAGFVRSGTAPRLVSDALAALTAINSTSGLPARGVVALLDFGGGGTSITLADAASDFEPIGKTLRYPGFSGNQIDEAVLVHVITATGRSGIEDSAATAAVGPIAQLTERCREAKERLSADMVADVVADSSKYRSSVRLTRAELENLINYRLNGVLSTFDELLVQHKLAARDLAAVVSVGGGACIPLLSQRLSAHTRAPVITAVQPAVSAALGAAMFASREPAVMEEASTAATATATAMAAVSAGMTTTGITGLPPADPFLDDEQPSAPPKLAWSEDDGTSMDPVPYTGDSYGGGTVVRPVRYGPEPEPPAEVPRGRRYRVPRLFLGLTALAAMFAIGGVAYNLTSTVDHKAPTQPSSPTMAPVPPSNSAAPVAPSPSPLPPPTVAPSAASSPELAPPPSPEPPPPSPSPEPPPVATTTIQPAPSATTTQPTTTAPATTTTTPSQAPTTTPADTSTSVPMTTQYLTLPLVPIPIPIQVPQNQAGVSPPQNLYPNPPGY